MSAKSDLGAGRVGQEICNLICIILLNISDASLEVLVTRRGVGTGRFAHLSSLMKDCSIIAKLEERHVEIQNAVSLAYMCSKISLDTCPETPSI